MSRRPGKHGRPAQRGVTLVELMLVVGLIAVLATLAIGFSGDWRRRNDHRRLTREAFNALNIARATALKKGKRVSVEFDDANQRLVVFEDLDNDQIWDLAEPVHVRFPRDDGVLLDFIDADEDVYVDMTITSTALAAAHAGNNTAIFDHQGFSISSVGAPLAAVILVTDTRLGRTYTVDVTIAGAIAIDPP